MPVPGASHSLTRGKSVRSWCDGSSDRSFMVEPSSYFHSSQCSTTGVTKAVVCAFMVDPSNYFSFQPVLHDWCYKGRGTCYPVCGIVHIKEPLLLIGKSSPYGGSRFPLSLSEWSFTICPTPYNCNYNVLSASLNKTLPSH